MEQFFLNSVRILIVEFFQNEAAAFCVAAVIWHLGKSWTTSFRGIFIACFFAALSSAGVGVIVAYTEHIKRGVAFVELGEAEILGIAGSFAISAVLGVLFLYPGSKGRIWIVVDVILALIIGVGVAVSEMQTAEALTHQFSWLSHAIGMSMGSWIVIYSIRRLRERPYWLYQFQVSVAVFGMSFIICFFDYWPLEWTKLFG